MDSADKKVFKSARLWLKYVMIPPTLMWLVYGQLLFEFFAENHFLLFIMGAAIFNAMMDTVTHHYYVSVFFSKNKAHTFFNPEISWNLAKQIGGYKLDFWHLCKSAMIFCLCFSIVSYNKYVGWRDLCFWLDFAFAGYLWNITFSLFYDIILRRK